MNKPSPAVFVIHTPFQRLIVHHMVRSMPEFSATDNFLVLDMKRDGLKIESDLFKEIIELTPPVGRYRLGSGRDCRAACRRIFDILNQYDSGSLFISDLLWPLCNALYGLAKKRGNGKYRLCNFPDGAANLTVKYPQGRRKMRNIIKAGVGMLGGFPYYTIRGEIAGIEDSDRVYSLLPKALPRIDNEIIAIPRMETTSSSAEPDSALFLGQPYDYVMSDSAFGDLCDRAARCVIDLGYKNLYYKSHHFAKTEIEKNIFIKHGFKVIEDRRPIEEIFLTHQMSCVLSYTSSALVNLKLLVGDDVRCVATFYKTAAGTTIEGMQAYDETMNLFKLCNVEMIG